MCFSWYIDEEYVGLQQQSSLYVLFWSSYSEY